MHPACRADHHHRRRRRLRRLLLFSNQFLDKVLFPARAECRAQHQPRQPGPALAVPVSRDVRAGLYLAYPVFETLRLSLTDRDAGWRLRRPRQLQSDGPSRSSGKRMSNNMLWLIVVPAASTAFGLLARSSPTGSWGNIAKSLIFMPMAISFVGAAVIFKLIYDTRPEDQDQIGI
jgi:alpha-glucoside transport system permease protein